MGFFSLKSVCAICEKDCGLNRLQIKDKVYICSKCFKEAGLTMISPVKTMSANDIKEIIRRRRIDADKLSKFKVTKQISIWLKIDENAREWFIPDGFAGSVKTPRIHSFDDILDFELIEDGNSIIKGGIGGAVVGGVLFGGVGAVIGGVAGKKKEIPICSSMKIKITLDDIMYPNEYINLITVETKKNSIAYKNYRKQAQDIISLFHVMCASKKTQQNLKNELGQEKSTADEIFKFKQLFDSGVITKEEFEIKKNQLLGIQ